ncbi:LPS biosynthesis protein WbpP [Segatella copri]|uniref:LPS biosynthesis protein WbpP n=1 Tax=Segatella copri TaxID=165179 RepID=A0AA91TKH4_9BACT|nr:SDR family oxidoreductase [Segatella copri]OXL44388.1 LPS biosynthesis protein WbpP [Segatella copri]
MRKILVTGGAGFIGSNLCEELVKKGNYVVCLDNFSTGRIENIQGLLDNNRFKLIEGDIRNLDTCLKAVNGVDVVFHEAALGSIPRSIDDPITTNAVNISGFLNMLVAAKNAKIDRFIFAASSSAYGDNETIPKVEDTIGKPLSPYALTKYVDELYAHVFSITYGLKYIGIRYFNVFGRRQDPNSAYAAVIPLFIKKLLKHEQPIINGDGSNSRDFTYIDNIIHINMLALETLSPKAFNQIYNGAGGENTSVLELEQLITKNLSAYDNCIDCIVPIFGPNRIGDVKHSKASISKARELLGYTPVCTFEDGLKKTIYWYLTNLKE